MIPEKFCNVTVFSKANIYFDGKVISHTVLFGEGAKKTIGLIFPGKFHFGTQKGERMEIVAGECIVKADGNSEIKKYGANSYFEVAPNSGFDIEVKTGICEYICSFLD
jgi:uncharacterized protein YaiE (UPF0345 family)